MQTPPPPPPPPAVQAVEYAGFWRRLGAFLIDGLILGVVTAPFTAGIMGTDPDTAAAISPGASAFSALVGWLYYALMESSSKQATLGKMAIGLRVTDLNGARIGFGKATGRHFAKYLSGLILLIGFVMIAFTERKQGLHDMLAGTLVVR